MSSKKNAVTKKNKNTPAKRSSLDTKPAATESKKLKPSEESKDVEIEIISICDSDDDDKKISAKPNKLEVDHNDDDDDDDDVIVLDADECRKASLVSFVPETAGLGVASISCDFNDDDEVQAIGGTNQMNLPHMRQHCSINKFVPDLRIALNNKSTTFAMESEGNQKFCSLCYCFVCDGPASECKYWKSEGNKYPNNHCLASDRGRDSSHWKQLRQANKPKSSDSSNTNSSYTRLNELLRSMFFESMVEPYCDIDGPFEPNDVRASRYKTLTKCRKCGWYSDLQGYPYLEREFCHACGRVASEAALDKKKERKFVPKEGTIWFGQKEIKFRVKTRDPRQLKYKKYWSKYEGTSGWVYDKAELEEDFFLHRIGTAPAAVTVARHISLFDFDDVPTSFLINSNISTLETEGIFFTNQNDKVLFQSLRDASFEYNIQGNWNRARAEGTFRVDLYMTPFPEDSTKSAYNTAATNLILGAWLDVFPLKLSEVTYGIPACELPPRVLEKQIQEISDTFQTISLSVEDVSKIYDEELSQNKKAVSIYNAEVAKITSEFLFTSSANTSHGGGICDSDNSLRGTLTRYYRESWFEDILFVKSGYFQYRYGGSCFGLKSYSRTLRRHDSEETRIYNEVEILSYLSHEDLEFVRKNLSKAADLIRKRHKKPSGLLQQLENLGHTSAPQPEGLNVNLLDFQQQTVQWALERETAPLGAQNFLWTNIPNVNIMVKNEFVPIQMYYSPVLGRFRRKEPQCVRGGIIAEEVGLGKTVISLSIILKNPAPLTPESGSLVRNYSLPSTSQLSSCPWGAVSKPSKSILPDAGEGLDPTLSNPFISSDSKIENESIKHASIYSHATLVVCNVSLVGQWIDEAKSKLKNPGLIYCYYGSNRTRDPRILAKNAIVVTTYAVLASDKYTHARKSNDANYCPPCEQIFWWRVIADESHTLRDTNTNNYRSLVSLRAVNKWCVSGTPIARAVDDVVCGLKFLEFDNVDPLFRVTRESKMKTGLLFFLRQVLMRHCNAQRNIKKDKNLIELPPRTERTVLVTFSSTEKTFYEKIEKKALDLYQEMKNMHRTAKELNRQYLKLHAALTPLRICCSGGSISESTGSNIATDDGYELRPEDSTICPICLDEMDNACATKCKPLPHIFCRECIEGVLDTIDGLGADCPVCRQRLKSNHLRQAYKRIEIVSEEKKEELNEEHIVFTSKFNRLLSELKSIRDTEPDAKSLVFTQFSSTLKFLKEELPKHGFQLRYLSGDMTMSTRANALRDFQNDPSTTVFLLSTRAGACGINLTHANRVFLMEPAMNPALERQAIGRVCRLGQKSIVQIIKLCMEDSFETRLMKILDEKYGDEKMSDQEEDEANHEDDQSSSGDESSDDSSCYGHYSSYRSSRSPPRIQTVKTNLLEDEFDRLFGIE